MKPQPRTSLTKSSAPVPAYSTLSGLDAVKTEDSSEMSEVILTSPEKRKVDLGGHCAICLTKFGGNSLTFTTNSPDLRTIWKCLPIPTGGNSRRQKLPPPWTQNLVFLQEGENENGTESELPHLCHPCQENVVTLTSLKEMLTEIQRKIQEQEKRLQETLKLSVERLSKLERCLLSKPDESEDCYENTLKFIQLLHGGADKFGCSGSAKKSKSKPPLKTRLKTKSKRQIASPRSQTERIETNDFLQTENLKNESNFILDGDNDDDDELYQHQPLPTPEAMDFNDEEDVKIGEIPVMVKIEESEDKEGDDEYFSTMEPEPPSPQGTSDSDRDSVNDDEQNESSYEDVTSRKKRKTKTSKTKSVAGRKKKPLSKSKVKRAESGPKPAKMFCQVCREKHPANQLLRHMQSHVSDYATKCPNPKCFHTFISQVHLERVHLPDSAKFSECRKIASLDSSMKKMCPLEDCGFQCDHNLTFRTHLKKHESPQKNFTCPMEKCGEEFTIRKNVEFHLMDIHLFQKDRVENDTMKCDQCSEHISIDKIEEHFQTTHQIPAQDIISCKSCPRKFSQRLKFIDHVTNSHREEGYTCDICNNDDLVFFRPKEFHEHFYVNHGVGTKVQCGQCTYTSYREDLLKIHMKNTHPAEDDAPKIKNPLIHSCEFCEEKFHAKSRLVSHLIRKHNASPLACTFCEKTFSDSVKLNKHVRTEHLGEAADSKVCTECGKIFSKLFTLKEHIRMKHHKIRLKCDQCDQTFSYQNHLTQHKRYQHYNAKVEESEIATGSGAATVKVPPPPTPKVHMCAECGKVFKEKGNLTQHMRRHTHERPYTCELCGSRFRQWGSLRNHRRTHERQGDNFKPSKTFDRGLDGKSKVD